MMRPLLALNSPAPQAVKSLSRRLLANKIRAIALTFTICLLLYLLRSEEPKQPPPPSFNSLQTTSSFRPVPQDAVLSGNNSSIQPLCEAFPRHLTQHRIQPVLKMGHGEDTLRRHAQLQSVSACFSSDDDDDGLLIFSDMNETLTLGDKAYRAVDIIAHLPPEAYIPPHSIFSQLTSFSFPSFLSGGWEEQQQPPAAYDAELANYQTMRQLQSAGKLTSENDPTTGKDGWALDKWKFLAEVERTWELRLDRDWYVFYESDTYVVWDNLFRFLGALDPSKEMYIGSPSLGMHEFSLQRGRLRTMFGNGGPGFVLSRAAMGKLLGSNEPGKKEEGSTGSDDDAGKERERQPGFLSLKWLDVIRSECCGDTVLGWALWKEGVPLTGLYPMFNDYPLHGVPYTERMWCQPVLSLHKTSPEDMMELWRWEQGRRLVDRPLLYADLYEFRAPGSPKHASIRTDWDNTDWNRHEPVHEVAADHLEACTKACEQEPTCFQYMWRGKERESCVLMPFISWGEAKKPTKETATSSKWAKWWTWWREEAEKTTSYTSGWLTGRVEKWKEEHVCAEPDWLEPSLERYFYVG